MVPMFAMTSLIWELIKLLAKVDWAGIGRRLAQVPVGLWIFVLVTFLLSAYLVAAGGAIVYLSVTEKTIPGILEVTLSASVGYLGGIVVATLPPSLTNRAERRHDPTIST